MASVFSVGIFRFIAAFGWYDARQIEFKFVPIAFFALRLRCSTECFLTTRGGVGTKLQSLSSIKSNSEVLVRQKMRKMRA
jgi:hypothetical protein